MDKTLLIVGLNIENGDVFGLDITKYDEIWTLNDFYTHFPNIQFNRVFQVHTQIDTNIKVLKNRWVNWINEYNKRKCTIMLLNEDKRLKHTELIPLIELYKIVNKNLFVNSFCYMLAFAIYKKFTHISLHGFSDNAEYGDSFQSCLAIIDIAIQKHIEIDSSMIHLWHNYSKGSWTQYVNNVLPDYGLAR